MGVIYEKSFWAFLFVTVIAGGGAAYHDRARGGEGLESLLAGGGSSAGAGSGGSFSALGSVCWRDP